MNKCIRLGGTLAVVETQEEQDFLSNVLAPAGAWLGAVDWLDEEKFSWVDRNKLTEDPGTFTYWREDQPNDFLPNQ